MYFVVKISGDHFSKLTFHVFIMSQVPSLNLPRAVPVPSLALLPAPAATTSSTVEEGA